MIRSFSDNNHQNNTMTLTGQGQVTSIPNIAIIRLGVQSTGDNLVPTQSENAQISQAILQSLKELGVTDIKTFQYLIDKNYIYEDGKRIDNGYTIRNIFEIKLSYIDQVGKVIDSAVNSGANVVEFISFEVADPEFYYQQALNLAVMNAIQKAKSISMNLGVPMDSIPIRIVENSTSLMPSSQIYTFREGAFATPIEPGHYQVDANVTAEFCY